MKKSFLKNLMIVTVSVVALFLIAINSLDAKADGFSTTSEKEKRPLIEGSAGGYYCGNTGISDCPASKI